MNWRTKWPSWMSWALSGVAFSPDGHRLATGADGTVTIWDATPLPEK